MAVVRPHPPALQGCVWAALHAAARECGPRRTARRAAMRRRGLHRVPPDGAAQREAAALHPWNRRSCHGCGVGVDGLVSGCRGVRVSLRWYLGECTAAAAGEQGRQRGRRRGMALLCVVQRSKVWLCSVSLWTNALLPLVAACLHGIIFGCDGTTTGLQPARNWQGSTQQIEEKADAIWPISCTDT